jgi:hypothetical protein
MNLRPKQERQQDGVRAYAPEVRSKSPPDPYCRRFIQSPYVEMLGGDRIPRKPPKHLSCRAITIDAD